MLLVLLDLNLNGMTILTLLNALSSVVVDGVTFNQTGRSGETDGILTVNLSDYPITINPGIGYGGKEVQNKDIGFYDLDGQDWNATLSIVRFEPEPQVSNTNGLV